MTFALPYPSSKRTSRGNLVAEADDHAIVPPEVPEDDEALPQDVVEKLGGPEAAKRVLAIAAEKFSGPLPHPRMLAQYREILPDAPDRIVSMAERQADHRTYLERTVVEQNERRANWGLGLGFVLLFVLLVGGLYLIAIGKELTGLGILVAIGATAIVNLMRVLRSRQHQLSERSGE